MKWARIALICAGFAGGLAGVSVSLLPKAPAVVTPQPGGILAGVDASDARMIRDFYAAMADVVVRDGSAQPPVCTSTFDLRNRHRGALSMAFASTGMVGKYPGLGDRLDKYLLAAIGDTDVQLTPEIRASAAKAFAAIK
jgi:hypothetical protein